MGYKVNKRLIGTKQVRPSVFEYNYDFRGKTKSEVETDGWFTYYNQPEYLDTRAWNVDSNGLHIAGYSGILLKSIDNTKFTNAKKIIISTHVNMTSYIYSSFIGASRWTGSSTNNLVGYNIDLRQAFRRIEFYGTNINQTSGSIPVGEYDVSIVFDLTQKTATMSLTGFTDIAGNLTDSDIASVRSNQNCVQLGFYNNSSYPTDTSSFYRNFYLRIEY